MESKWEVPVHDRIVFSGKVADYCIIVVTWNEGERLKNQLARMRERAHLADIIIADGASEDASTDQEFLREMKVRALLSTTEVGLATATRMGYAYALEEGYKGIMTVDGNGKDGVEAVGQFISKLEEGYDLIQGSRFLPGGEHANTPWERYIGIRYILCPLFALGCGYYYTDPTNAFRACSYRFLNNKKVQPIRDVFVHFNIHHYLISRAAKLKFRVTEIPVKRVYPEGTDVPTKIRSWRMKLRVLWEAIFALQGKYNP